MLRKKKADKRKIKHKSKNKKSMRLPNFQKIKRKIISAPKEI